jgi:hypothetical protein
VGCRLILVEDIVIALATDDELASGVGSREGQRPPRGCICHHGQHGSILNSEPLIDAVQMNLDGALGYLQLPPISLLDSHLAYKMCDLALALAQRWRERRRDIRQVLSAAT